MPDLDQLLLEAEGSGRIEYKRSVLWPLEAPSTKVQRLLMRLANANPGTGGVLCLGREDDGKFVGLVDQTLVPAPPPQLKAAQQKLVQLAAELVPQMALRWHLLARDGGEIVLVEVPGRVKGSWYATTQGEVITGSASHPLRAGPDLMRLWAQEGLPETFLYRLRVQLHSTIVRTASAVYASTAQEVLAITLQNIGQLPVHLGYIDLLCTIDDRHVTFRPDMHPYDFTGFVLLNPTYTPTVEPGRSQTVYFSLATLARSLTARVPSNQAVLCAVHVFDQAGTCFKVVPSAEVDRTITRVLRAELGHTAPGPGHP